MASRSQRHAPEVAYDPYFDDRGTAAYDAYGPYDAYGSQASTDAYGSSVPPGTHDAYSAYATDGTHGAVAAPPAPAHGVYAAGQDGPGDEPFEEWNPTEDTVRPVRGRHRVGKQRSGGMARSGAVLGVGMMAAVGAGGMATAQDKGPASISMPDLASAAGAVKDLPQHLPDAEQLPGVGDLISDDSAGDSEAVAAAPLTQAGLSADEAAEGTSHAGEALRARILAQAEQQQSEADAVAREKAAQEAAHQAAAEAQKSAAAEKKAEAERKKKIEAEKKRKAEAERLAKLAKQWTAPLGSYQLSAGFGQGGGMWQNDHTGQDFAAPNGTPVKAVHTGTVKEAGWAGSYGYRVVLQLDDGTELWFCHLSSMTKSAGEKVRTGDVIGRVGSTGNSSGPHLHVEVRPGGGDPVDPMPWLRGKGVKV